MGRIGEIICREQQLQIGDIRWTLLRAGHGSPVMLLHGFPDTPHTFRHQLPVLIEAGYEVILPWLPGYTPDSLAQGKRYDASRLSNDLHALLTNLALGPLSIIGHDWGGFAAYLLAAQQPQLLDKLLTIAIPQASAMQAADWQQAKRSRYMLAFQLPGAARRFRRDNFKALHRLLQEWSPDWADSSAHAQHCLQVFENADCLDNAIAYYRSMARAAIFNARFRQQMATPISVNTRCIAGLNDGCIGVEVLREQSAGFCGDYQLIEIPDAGHFCHVEQADAVNAHIIDFLGRSGEGA